MPWSNLLLTYQETTVFCILYDWISRYQHKLISENRDYSRLKSQNDYCTIKLKNSGTGISIFENDMLSNIPLPNLS